MESRSASVTAALEASSCVAAAAFLSSVVASGAGPLFGLAIRRFSDGADARSAGMQYEVPLRHYCDERGAQANFLSATGQIISGA